VESLGTRMSRFERRLRKFREQMENEGGTSLNEYTREILVL
jgi:hypothetical protein